MIFFLRRDCVTFLESLRDFFCVARFMFFCVERLHDFYWWTGSVIFFVERLRDFV